jgi:2Fe-2S ferredoxin
MPKIKVIDRSGSAKEVEAVLGQSLMEVVRDNGFDELLALCGGCCSCATCHVIIDPAFVSKLRPMDPDENDLLDGTTTREATSRLSCQIKITEELEGVTLTIAPED